MKKLFIKNIKINRFRALRNLQINFNENFNLIEARNGLGKSSILDAIRYIIFKKNSTNVQADNYKTIPNDELPDIELILNFDYKNINLKTKNNKWFIDDIEYKKFDEYQKGLLKELNIDGSNRFFELVNPFSLMDVISSKTSQDKKILKDRVISLINEGLDSNYKIDDFNALVQRKNELKEQKDKLSKEIKTSQQEIERYKSNFPEITNWDIEPQKSIGDSALVQEQINNYTRISNDINLLNDEINKLTTKITNSISNIKEPTIEEKPKMKRGLYIFLCIITFGVYYLITKKKQKQLSAQNNNNSIASKEYQRKILEQQKEEKIKEREKLMNDPAYKDVDLEKLIAVKESLKLSHGENLTIEIRKNKYKTMIKELNSLRDKYLTIENDYTNVSNQYLNVSKVVEEFVNRNFKNFNIDFSNNKSDDKFIISQNSIDVNFLNYANKLNVVLELNQFIKNELKIDNFILVDQAESFNNLYTENLNCQTIACKVTNDEVIKVNGKPLY